MQDHMPQAGRGFHSLHGQHSLPKGHDNSTEGAQDDAKGQGSAQAVLQGRSPHGAHRVQQHLPDGRPDTGHERAVPLPGRGVPGVSGIGRRSIAVAWVWAFPDRSKGRRPGRHELVPAAGVEWESPAWAGRNLAREARIDPFRIAGAGPDRSRASRPAEQAARRRLAPRVRPALESRWGRPGCPDSGPESTWFSSNSAPQNGHTFAMFTPPAGSWLLNGTSAKENRPLRPGPFPARSASSSWMVPLPGPAPTAWRRQSTLSGQPPAALGHGPHAFLVRGEHMFQPGEAVGFLGRLYFGHGSYFTSLLQHMR